MIIGSSEQSFTVYCTPAMATWCEQKARADPGNGTYRIVGGEIKKSLNASRILTCKYGHLVQDGEVAVFDEHLTSQFHLLGPDTGVLCAPSMFMAFDVLPGPARRRDIASPPLNHRKRSWPFPYVR
jgi:hypothetical protein